MTGDPFGALGLGRDASADDVRAARRRLAKEHHPDRGGDPAVMRSLNVAAAAALGHLGVSGQPPSGPGPHGSSASGSPSSDRPASGATREEPSGTTIDMPSFTVEALPVETFEALLIVAGETGEVLDDDPPYRLDVDLHPPVGCWCRLDLVPDAGATTVGLTIAAYDDRALPEIEAVRDAWVDRLNRLDWGELGSR